MADLFTDTPADLAIIQAAIGVGRSTRLAQLLSLRPRRDYVGVHPSPPTVTMGTPDAASTVNGNALLSPSVPFSDSRLGCVGRFATYLTNYGVGIDTNYGTRNIGGYSSGGIYYQSNTAKWTWETDEPTFDIAMGANQIFQLWVDGYPIGTSRNPFISPSGGSGSHVNINWGTDTPAYAISGSPTISAAGTGHAVGDELTFTGGTGTAFVLRVTGVSGGAITSWILKSAGNYSVAPGTSALPQASTTGAGTGATATVNAFPASRSTRKVRRYELRFLGGGRLIGLQITNRGMVRAAEPTGPLFITYGDSITEGREQRSPGETWCGLQAELLGVEANIASGVGGNGYLRVSGGSVTLSERLSTDLDPYIAADPNRSVVLQVALGINDYLQGTSAALVQAKVTTDVSAIIARAPKAFLLVYGPWEDKFAGTLATRQAMEAAIFAGAQAATGWDAKQHACIPVVGRYITGDNGVNDSGATAAGNSSKYLGADGVHPGFAGSEEMGQFAADAAMQAFMGFSLAA